MGVCLSLDVQFWSRVRFGSLLQLDLDLDLGLGLGLGLDLGLGLNLCLGLGIGLRLSLRLKVSAKISSEQSSRAHIMRLGPRKFVCD